MKNVIKIIISICAVEIAGIIGSIFTIPAINTWYKTLVLPEFAPPNWIFGPVWTTLFALMGISTYLIWKKGLDKKEIRKAIYIFIFQLILNVLWSIIFFGLNSPFNALIEIISLWLAILATMIAYYRISKLAMWLLLPYILWVSFAGYLNYSIWILNK